MNMMKLIVIIDTYEKLITYKINKMKRLNDDEYTKIMELEAEINLFIERLKNL